MSNYTDQDRALALIGIYQASKLVFDLATTGKLDESAFKTTINSLFAENPTSTLDVYGDDAMNIQLGVRTLLSQMGSSDAPEIRNLEITRYALSLILLERSVIKEDGALDKIARTLETAKTQRAHFGDWHENVIASIARAYTENVSNLNPRIMVKGQHGHLQNPHNANKIRALLLAGIRSALLWRQVGGSRWGLIWSRKKYLRSAQALNRTPPRDPNESLFRKH
ncbi:high frequency lysogenization protein HflD [Thiomicrospira microaerophila]|uniref:high frequency lysogenization protein HflD n=1 Tax=Thiomicrospira microaerophila TaxID=406020 RepID=UPI00200C3AFE|nr:high frequency lysogenization protein HflD [Thiomicrospira microaerophila]UQB41635.1 high frequency lysogenization protein HflD [Thiomicrospira microaerophila]